MPSLIGLFYELRVVPAAPSSPAQTDEAAREALRESMRRDFEALLRQAAPLYERLSPTDRRAFFPAWLALQGRMDRAYQEGASAEFQAVLAEAKALLAASAGSANGVFPA